jgi:hypothetical protein
MNNIKQFLKEKNLNLDLNYISYLNKRTSINLFEKIYFEESFFNQGSFDIELNHKDSIIISQEYNSIKECLNEYLPDNDSKISIAEIYNNTNLLEIWSDFVNNHNLFDMGFLPIGEIDNPQSSLLLIGTKVENKNEIWMEVSNSMSLIWLKNDFITLINDITITYDDFIKSQTNDFNKLYKKWGEDFWRVKED